MRAVCRCVVRVLPMVVITLGSIAFAQMPAPGETSGSLLAPLLVEAFDPDTGELKLVYQTGCDATNNNIYFGALDQVSSLTWSGEVCDIGNGGNVDNFAPGPGSYFFVVVGNRGTEEGSYGEQSLRGSQVHRPPYVGTSCGQTQDLSTVCTQNPLGQSCSSSLDCPSRQTCVESAVGSRQCECLPPFGGAFCEQCATGFEGPDCRDCEPGYFSNAFAFSTGDYVPQETTSPLTLLCEPDVTESCDGESCSGRGVCALIDREAVCACDDGYTGTVCEQCAPDYELESTSGACVLGDVCRAAKCGDHGDCVATPFGEVTCDCDAGSAGVDCGGPDFAIASNAERFSLYDGETVILDPVGGRPPYSWTILEGPATVTPCAPGGACPFGSAELTVVVPAGGITTLELIRVSLSDTTGNHAIDDLVALPPSCLPFTGEIHSELLPFYQAMLKYMKARGIRAGALAISRGGKQIAANGYGFRDAGLDADPYVNAGEGPAPLVQPNSPFRLASVSKPLAAAAVRQAATDAGVNIASTSLSERAARWVQDSIGFSLTGGAPTFDYNLLMPLTTDTRWADISIQHLLNHHAGFDRKTVPPSTTGQPGWNEKLLPFTEDLFDPEELQTARSGAGTKDMVIASMYAVAARKLKFDPRPTPEQMIRFASGTLLNYNPGFPVGNVGDNYSNLGYILLGRVLEGLAGETYDPDEPGVTEGWGAFAPLLQDYLCEASGIQNGVFPGDAFHPQPLEPYYRSLDWQGNEIRAWNMAEGSDKIRFNEGIQQWQFCQSGCPNNGAVWNDELNTPVAYGGVWLASANSAGGLVATAPALLKFARNHRVKIGTPYDGSTGIGTKLPAPGAHTVSSDHGGSLDGTLTELWQMNGQRTNRVPSDGGSWNSDPSAPLDLDDDGRVIVSEPLVSKSCTLPSGVVVAALFNQRQDQRAPFSNRSSDSTSDPVKVYFRIKDFLANAACKVDLEGWPELSDGGPVLQAPCP